MSRNRRVVVLVLLALLVVAPFAAFALETCADDDCSPSCGDCALCGQVAVGGIVAAAVAPLVAELEPRDLASRLCAAPARSVEHVPLPQR